MDTAKQSFYTPPTTPIADPELYYTPPTSPPTDPVDDDPDSEIFFPVPSDMAIDLALDEDGLTTLEKIYLYSRSKAYHHRIFIVHELHQYLHQVTPQEAVEYVLPLLSGLAMDDDDSVKEALAAELVPVIWWFFSHCQVIPDDLSNEEIYASSSTTVTISVQAFTPILGTLLLNENNRVGILARDALVGFLARMNKVDERLHGIKKSRRRRTPLRPWEIPQHDDDEPLPDIDLFGSRERSLFRQEILQQIVLGLGQLDDEEEIHQHQSHQEPQHQSQQIQSSDWSNPYFPPVPTLRPASVTTTPSQSPSSSQRNSPIHDYSPGVEFPPGATSPGRSPVRQSNTTPDSSMNDGVEYYEDQGTLGRIACMSLVAAVTAGGPMDDDTLRSFLDEVERIVHDPYFKVRQATSFALGALAKEIPEDLVPRLMPLFDSLRWDTVWVVRHSALFALPAILGRLSPPQRRTVALETVVALSADKNSTVRCGVLECLGEVLYTFINDDHGPPEQLIQLFLGRKEDKTVRTGPRKQTYTSLQSALQSMNTRMQNHAPPLESFYMQPKRPLICAFNFPAIVLTLGGYRWSKLRENYLDLVQNPNVDVSRTLAASVGEIAKIIGAGKARQDLVDVWRAYLRSSEGDVRMKALESLLDLMKVVIDEERRIGIEMVGEVGKVWKENLFRGWRERDCIQKKLVAWLKVVWSSGIAVAVFRDLLMKGLEDSAANVREAAIANIPAILAICSDRAEVMEAFWSDINQLATSSMSRRRMTFVSCHQHLVLSHGYALTTLDDTCLQTVAGLVDDGIEGVRIGVARFVALLYRNFLRHATPVPHVLRELLHGLSQDASHEVRSYVAQATLEESAKRPDTPQSGSKCGVALFSRPPVPSVYDTKGVRKTVEEPFSDDSAMDTKGDDLLFSSLHGDMNMVTESVFGASAELLGLASNTVSGVYCEPSSPSYTYDLVGAASEQLQVPA